MIWFQNAYLNKLKVKGDKKSVLPVSFDAERLDSADEVEIQIDSADKTAEKVEELTDRYRIESGEVDIGSW